MTVSVLSTNIVVNATLKIREAKRLARRTLFAPTELPRRAPVASVMPSGTLNKRACMFKQIVSEASGRTPMTPAKIVSTSNAHHSAQSMAVEGRLTRRYGPQPLSAFLSSG